MALFRGIQFGQLNVLINANQHLWDGPHIFEPNPTRKARLDYSKERRKLFHFMKNEPKYMTAAAAAADTVH